MRPTRNFLAFWLSRPAQVSLSLGIILVTGQVLAGEITVSTFFPSPDTEYREAKVDEKLRVGLSADPGSATFKGKLNVKNDQRLNGSLGQGGFATVDGDFTVNDHAGNKLLFVNAATHQVGINTGMSPILSGAKLDVRGEVKSSAQFAVSAVGNAGAAYTRIGRIENTVDNYENYFSATGSVEYGGFAGAFTMSALFLDGKPLVFQTVVKGPVENPYKGQVYISSYDHPSYHEEDRSIILIVGPRSPSFPTWAYATNWDTWPASSASLKTSIRPFMPSDYKKQKARILFPNSAF